MTLLREAAASVDEEAVEVIAPPAPIRWRLDRLGMHQVSTNLLRNAVQSEGNGERPQATVAVENRELVFVSATSARVSRRTWWRTSSSRS